MKTIKQLMEALDDINGVVNSETIARLSELAEIETNIDSMISSLNILSDTNITIPEKIILTKEENEFLENPVIKELTSFIYAGQIEQTMSSGYEKLLSAFTKLTQQCAQEVQHLKEIQTSLGYDTDSSTMPLDYDSEDNAEEEVISSSNKENEAKPKEPMASEDKPDVIAKNDIASENKPTPVSSTPRGYSIAKKEFITNLKQFGINSKMLKDDSTIRDLNVNMKLSAFSMMPSVAPDIADALKTVYKF